jgi:hypothetical protein
MSLEGRTWWHNLNMAQGWLHHCSGGGGLPLYLLLTYSPYGKAFAYVCSSCVVSKSLSGYGQGWTWLPAETGLCQITRSVRTASVIAVVLLGVPCGGRGWGKDLRLQTQRYKSGLVEVHMGWNFRHSFSPMRICSIPEVYLHVCFSYPTKAWLPFILARMKPTFLRSALTIISLIIFSLNL